MLYSSANASGSIESRSTMPMVAPAMPSQIHRLPGGCRRNSKMSTITTRSTPSSSAMWPSGSVFQLGVRYVQLSDSRQSSTCAPLTFARMPAATLPATLGTTVGYS
ncbi:MAG: hypothetical protein EBU70_12200 [Actinobacteria bacterium]|nr:hypothetical protein [Actinomycetota bacterium]